MKYLPIYKRGALVAGLATAGLAQAQIDTAAAVTEIGNVGTAVAAVGGALIGVAALVLAYRWVKAQFF